MEKKRTTKYVCIEEKKNPTTAKTTTSSRMGHIQTHTFNAICIRWRNTQKKRKKENIKESNKTTEERASNICSI